MGGTTNITGGKQHASTRRHTRGHNNRKRMSVGSSASLILFVHSQAKTKSAAPDFVRQNIYHEKYVKRSLSWSLVAASAVATFATQ